MGKHRKLNTPKKCSKDMCQRPACYRYDGTFTHCNAHQLEGMIWGLKKASENIASIVPIDPSNPSSSKRPHSVDSEVKQAWSKLLTFVEPGKKKIKADSQGLKEDISTDVAIIEDTDANSSDVVAKNGRLDHIVSKGAHSYVVKSEFGHLSLASL